MKRITELPEVKIHETAWIDAPVTIGPGTSIWHFSHIQPRARLGKNCTVGQNVNIANDVTIGNNVKIQNNVSVYNGCEIEDDVFLGPSCVLTNVSNPRSQIDRKSIYEKTLIRRGASVGANATIVCGITIGRYSFIGAGSVVTRSVPDYALVTGNPARIKGWMSRHGHKLEQPDSKGIYTCPESGLKYQEQNGTLRCLDIEEEETLPENMQKSTKEYRAFK